MGLRTVTWNIGGGKLLSEQESSSGVSTYSVDGIESIAKWLKEVDADIVAIQEAHGDFEGNQVRYIAEYLGYSYYNYDPVADSHIDSTQKLGNGLISKYPMSDQRTGRFLNPNMMVKINGDIVLTHEKGYISCDIVFEGSKISITTVHLLPFQLIGIDLKSEIASRILSSVSSEMNKRAPTDHELILGDFNINSSVIGPYMKRLFETRHLKEVDLKIPTTPDGGMYDHVLYNGLSLKEVDIDSSVKTDHYPVMCNFGL